ncbi:MAG: hypothetical protein K2W85_06960 [Phycisphaerales bacterium]|nr:hypothetical protein [Phycisphaerales bacterium]
MRTLIAMVLFLAGLGVVLYGLGSALFELIGLYSSALSDPLSSTGPEANAEPAKVVGDRMWRFALIGMAGVPFLLIGSIMLSLGFWARVRRMVSPARQ